MPKRSLNPKIQTDSVPEKLSHNQHLLLLCDFSGKIVFCKGDPKVLQLPISSYLHKNFFSFNFTLHSKLTLATRLNFDLYKEGHRETFQLELVKSDCQVNYKPSARTSRIPLQRLYKMLSKQIKLLNVSASCIQVTFRKVNEVNNKLCLLEYFDTEQSMHISEAFENHDKLLMFEIDSDIENQAQNCKIFNQNGAKVQQKLIDINYCRNQAIHKVGGNEKGTSSAFSLYSFEDIPLPVKRIHEKEEENWGDLMNQQKKEEGYFTRSRKKVKINDDDKGSKFVQQFVEENEFLNIDFKN